MFEFYTKRRIEKTILSTLEKTLKQSLSIALKTLPIRPTISIEDQSITLSIESDIPSAFLQNAVFPALSDSLKNDLPDYDININVQDNIKPHQTQFPGKGLKNVKNVIAVASGKGGVGKSTVAVNLAIALAKSGASVGILDADIYGPSIPLMLGEVSPVQTQDNRYLPVNAHGIQAMSIGYLTQDEPALIWRGPMLAKSMLQMLDITEWNNLDYLIIDLPPGTGDIQLSLVQKIPVTGAVIVTTPQSVATLDAEKALKMFAKTNIDVLGIIENMSTHICSQCQHEEAIFHGDKIEALCEQYHCALLGKLPLNSQISQDCDNGKPTTAYCDNQLAHVFMKAALLTSAKIAKKPLNYAHKFPPIKVE